MNGFCTHSGLHHSGSLRCDAGIAGQAPEAWAIGGRCQAYSSIDGSWYTATVTGVSAAGHFVVQLDQGGPEEEVPPCFTPPPSLRRCPDPQRRIRDCWVGVLLGNCTLDSS